MPLSVQGLDEITEFASSHNMPLEIVSDPQFKSQQTLQSLSMAQAGYFNHFPGYFTRTSEGIIHPLRFGYIFSTDLEAFTTTPQIKEKCL